MTDTIDVPPDPSQFQSSDTTVETVHHPPHYCAGAIECIDAIESALGRDGFIAYLRGSMMKYAWRMLHKGMSLEDAQKLGWYQRRLVETMGND